jgi:non-specific protein-tyrosine kinase
MVIPADDSPASVLDEGPSIDLRQYLALIIHWWWLILLATFLATGVGYLISRQTTPIYRASTMILISEGNSGQAADYSSLLTSERLASTYARIITTRPVLEMVIYRLGLPLTPNQLASMVTVTPVRDTQLIIITVDSTNPGLSGAVANALYLVFSEQIQETQSSRYSASKDSLKVQMTETENEIADLRQAISSANDPSEIDRLETRFNQYRQIYANLLMSYEQIRTAEAQALSNVVQLEKAVAPTNPIRPRTMQNILIGAIAGFFLSVGGIFVSEAFDDTVKSPEEITRRLRLPIMGAITRYEEPEGGQLITCAQPRSPIAETFRALRTNVQYASVDHPIRTLIVTSPAPADGKTTIAANLATVIAQSGVRVTVVDADLHRPRAHHVFQVAPRPGLSNLFIKSNVHLDGSYQPTNTDSLHVITAGELPPNPSELLGSKKMREIIDAILAESDMVFIDTPPVLSVTDAVVLAPIVDGVLIVIRPGVTKMAALKTSVEQLRYVGANLVGVVLNGIDERSVRYGYYYRSHYYSQYKYYRSDDKDSARSARKLLLQPHGAKKEAARQDPKPR